jgi:transketolase
MVEVDRLVIYIKRTLTKYLRKKRRKKMTDQTRWGIDLVHTKNKAIKRQKDIVKRSLAEVDKLEEQYIVELMMEIEAIYERKYGENKINKLVL